MGMHPGHDRSRSYRQRTPRQDVPTSHNETQQAFRGRLLLQGCRRRQDQRGGEKEIMGRSDDGARLSLTLQLCPKVTTPLVSVLRVCEIGNEVAFTDDGGVIRNPRTGASIPIHKDEGRAPDAAFLEAGQPAAQGRSLHDGAAETVRPKGQLALGRGHSKITHEPDSAVHVGRYMRGWSKVNPDDMETRLPPLRWTRGGLRGRTFACVGPGPGGSPGPRSGHRLRGTSTRPSGQEAAWDAQRTGSAKAHGHTCPDPGMVQALCHGHGRPGPALDEAPDGARRAHSEHRLRVAHRLRSQGPKVSGGRYALPGGAGQTL